MTVNEAFELVADKGNVRRDVQALKDSRPTPNQLNGVYMNLVDQGVAPVDAHTAIKIIDEYFGITNKTLDKPPHS